MEYSSKIWKDLMLGLNETIDQLALANCVYWYGDGGRMVMS